MKKIFAFCLPQAAAGLLLLLSGCGENSPENYMNRAVLQAEKGDWAKAEKTARKAVEKYPDVAAMQVLRAIMAERTGNRSAALDAARHAVELEPDNFIAQYTLGKLYSQDKMRSSEAEQALVRAWTLNNQDRRTVILLCNNAMQVQSGRAAGYLNMLASDPEIANSARYHNQRAINYVLNGNYNAARISFGKAFKLAPDDPDIVLNVARFYDGCLRNRNLAVKVYRHYLKVAENNASGAAEAGARISILTQAK